MSDEKGLTSLILWQKSLLFAVNIGKTVLQKFPDEEKWALSSQIRRSAESISANIAEGYGRYYYQEGIHFAYIARGSLEETYSHLMYAKAMNYIAEDELNTMQNEIDELKRLINGYINYLKKSKRGISEPGTSYSADLESIVEDQINDLS